MCEASLQKYEKEISQLESKLQNEVDKNKENGKELLMLRKEKINIKENS
jgi:hypothetical protein